MSLYDFLNYTLRWNRFDMIRQYHYDFSGDSSNRGKIRLVFMLLQLSHFAMAILWKIIAPMSLKSP